MNIRWGLVPVTVACLFWCGCVAGPDDLVSQSAQDDDTTQVAANDAATDGDAAESEIVQVANVSMENRPAFQTTSSGLKYRILKEGKGRKPNRNSTVTCHYKGWLDNGKEFDSSYGGSAATFPLNGVIKGWTEGLQLVQEGGMIELEIPAELGYGPGGQPPVIPPNATLHFDVEVLKVR